MADKIPDLVATVRTGTGKGAARQARRSGFVPGIVFGGETEPSPINIPFNVLLKKLKEGRFKSTLFNMKVEGQEDVRVICRDVQRDVVKDLPTHVDFMRLRRTTKINLFIPIEFLNHDKCTGIKRGGALVVIRPEIELIATAGNIPEKITIDLEGLNIGDTITISSVELPADTKPTIDRDFVIANIAAPKGLGGSDDEEAESEEAEAEVTEGDQT